MIPKWTDEDLIIAHQNSRSIAEILMKLNLKPAGGNYKTINLALDRLGLDRPCPDRGWSKGKTLGPKREIQDYLIYGKVNSWRLGKRLISEGLKEHKCENCQLQTWMGNPIPLELDHIDGNHYNNLLENLRLLCPNCHALTETYRGKNIGKAPYANGKSTLT